MLIPAVRFLLFALLFALAATAYADTPLRPPTKTETFSPDRTIVAVSDPDTESTTLFRISDKGERTKLWAMYGWHRSLSVHNDGEHVIIGRGLLPLKHSKSEPIIHFIRKGELIRVVPLDELITDGRNLLRTVSHHDWGSIQGFDRRGRLVVYTNEDVYYYDPETGKRVEAVKINE